jgi:steroid delta-isomerase-like uncharacterized protein
MSDPAASTRAVARAVFDAFEAHDFSAFRDLLADDATLHDPSTGATFEGADAVVGALETTLTAFPDLKPEVTNLLVEGEQAAAEVMRTATHTGPLATPDGALPPTGERVRMPECIVMRVVGGQLVSMTTYLDRLSLMRQLGLAG